MEHKATMLTHMTIGLHVSLLFVTFGQGQTQVGKTRDGTGISGLLPPGLIRGTNFTRTENSSVDVLSWEEPRVLADLVSFMVNTGTGRQVLLLHDDSTLDLSPIVRAINDRWGDVTVVAYKNDLALLESMLRSYHYAEETRNVVVICDKSHVLQIFEEIRRRNLESPTTRWYVVLQDNVTSDLAASLREGSLVSVALKKSFRSYRFFSTFVDMENNVRIENIGVWRWHPDREATWFLRSPLTSDLEEEYVDFGARVLKGAVLPNWPFFKVTPLDAFDGPFQKAAPHSGIDANVINAIAHKQNFTYKLLLTDLWGIPLPNGTVTGMVGMVARRDVDFAINEITITGPRESVVDFSTPYFFESAVVLTAAPAEKSRATAVFSPFTPQVWAMLILSTLVIGPVLTLATFLMESYLQKKLRLSPLTYGFLMFGVILRQGNLIESPYWPQRFVFFFWYLFSFYIYAVYSGTLTAVFAAPSFEKPIDSLWDLRKAIDEKGYTPVLLYDTSNVELLQDATSGIYKEIWDRFQPDVGYVFSVDEGVEKVLTGKYAYLRGWLGAEIRAHKLGKHKFHMGRQTFDPQGYGIALHHGCPYKKIFDKRLRQLVESGLVDKWTRDEVSLASEEQSSEGQRGRGPTAVTLNHLQAAFFMLGIGILVAACALILEKIFYKNQRNARRIECISRN